MDDRITAYKAEQQDNLEKLVPYLMRVDFDYLKRIEEAYQAEQHSKLFGLSLSSDEVAEVHAAIKGAHHFLMWFKEKKRKAKTEG